MASALGLNAQATIMSGQGLAPAPDLISALTSYRDLPTVTLITKIFNDATTANADVRGNLWEALDTIGSGVSRGQFLIDFYSQGVSPSNSTGTISACHVDLTPIYDENPAHWTTVTDEYGSTTIKPIIGYNHIPALSTASVSQNVESQANLPFANGMSGFANVYTTSYAWATDIFDTVSSIHLLKDKTYSQSGVGYTDSADIITNGIGRNGPLIASVIEHWGTMYDVNKLGSFYDPYVFGEYLLLQGFGMYGNLNGKLAAAGLDLGTLTRIPTTVSSTTLSSDTQKVSAPFVGQLDLPDVKVKTTTSPVTGSSPAVVVGIYKTVKGTDLESIVTGTQIDVGHHMVTLADFLDFNKVIPGPKRVELQQIGIVDFPGLAKVLNRAVGSGAHASWASLANLLRSLEAPELKYTSVTPGQTVLTQSAVSTLTNHTGVGTGPFNNPTMIDLLGATAGIPYINTFKTIVEQYRDVSQGIETALSNLDSAVTYYLTHYTYTTTTDTETGGSSSVITPPSLDPVTSAVNSLNDALNALPQSSKFINLQNQYNEMCTQLSNEVANLHTAGVVFNAGNAEILKQFARSAINFSVNDDSLSSKDVFKNIVTNNAAGDTIRAAIAEKNNSRLLSGAGIETHNDPQPGLSIVLAKAQNIPIQDYVKRNI